MNNIKQLRKQMGISVTELATRLNMSQSNLTKIENNQIELKEDVAKKVAEALNVSTKAITSVSNNREGMVDLQILNPEAVSLPAYSSISLPALTIPDFSTDLAIYIAIDDTMTPTINKDNLVIINQAQITPSNSIFLVKYANKLYLRRLYTSLNGQISLIADNKSYPAEPIDLSSLELIGQVHSIINFHQP